MKWLKRKLRDWVREEEDNYRAEKDTLVPRSESHSPDCDPILNFRIFSANNGQILEFRHFDRKTDRSYTSTYIVENNDDMGEYVSKCLSMELLK